MKNKIGSILMILGTAFVFTALSLLIYNQHIAASAAKASTEVLSKLIVQIEENNAESNSPDASANAKSADTAMDTITIEGEAYIGYLTLPSLGLELPILSEWSYPRLQTAPCRFAGTVNGNDLVLMGHNYVKHFGPITDLLPGENVYFQDVYGVVTEYEVVAVDVLPATAVEEMTAGNFDLTVFTCDYSGQSRVTVRCNRS